MTDQYFTPTDLANALASSATVRRVKIIADFAAGHGNLLTALKKRWPNAHMLATDIDPRCVRELSQNYPSWDCFCCDFLDSNSIASNWELQRVYNKCDLIVLNPPFSGRGGAFVSIQNSQGVIKCSRAMAFVISAIQFLRKGGEICAILPVSCLTSVKDKEAREFCYNTCEVNEIDRFNRKAFPGCNATTALIKLRKKRVKESSKIRSSFNHSLAPNSPNISVKIKRGCVPVFRAENGYSGGIFPFVHSTDLRNFSVSEIERNVHIEKRIVCGPAVLIARVGSPSSKKCAIHYGSEPIVLSDCVIAIECRTKKDAGIVQKRIHENWLQFT
ncbi:MAG: N-6 DNA methylase, partial [Ekhidna sp.]